MFDTGRLSPSEDDISVFVSRLVEAEVSEAQLGAWLMATYVHGLSVQVSLMPYNINSDTVQHSQETACLTRAMVGSGVSLEWPASYRHLVVDKHSTGGVGDKVHQH